MKTANEWWQETKLSESAINAWLMKQWRGEVTASQRIRRFAEQHASSKDQHVVLNRIAEQEDKHGMWIAELLKARGIDVQPAEIENAEKRYWKDTLPMITDFQTGAAVAAHAEKMRLERICVIADDQEAPADIREVFQKILLEEVWHERAFRELSSDGAMAATLDAHEVGMQALGLVA